MKTLKSCLVLMLSTLGVIGTAYAAEGEMVISPAKRQEALDQAKGLLATKGLVPPGKDPFRGEASDPVPNPNPSPNPNPGPIPHLNLLQAIAASPSLKPSGFYVLGGQPTLVFGQKRVKAGGLLKITFEGTEYDLEIVSIVPPNFTLRLNREEFTRPIK